MCGAWCGASMRVYTLYGGRSTVINTHFTLHIDHLSWKSWKSNWSAMHGTANHSHLLCSKAWSLILPSDWNSVQDDDSYLLYLLTPAPVPDKHCSTSISVLVCFSVSLIKLWPKAPWGGKGLFWFPLPGHSPSLRDIRTETQTRTEESRTLAADCSLLAHGYFRSADPRAQRWCSLHPYHSGLSLLTSVMTISHRHSQSDWGNSSGETPSFRVIKGCVKLTIKISQCNISRETLFKILDINRIKMK